MRVPDSASRGWSPARLSLTLVVVASCCAQAQSLSESPLLMVETLLNKVPHDSHTPQRVSGYFEVNSTHAGRMWYMVRGGWFWRVSFRARSTRHGGLGETERCVLT